MSCGHEITVSCKDVSSLSVIKCTSFCDDILPCGHPCNLPCHFEGDKYVGTNSSHNKKCAFPCSKLKLKCRRNHICDKLCYQNPCDVCNIIIPETRLPQCQHLAYNLECNQDPEEICCDEICGKSLPNCNHFCKFKCGDCGQRTIGTEKTSLNQCPPCVEMVSKVFECGEHSVITECATNIGTCSVMCSRTLPCSHPCKNKCGEECGGCDVLIESSASSSCGHSRKVLCGQENDILDDSICQEICGKLLVCSHVCNLVCGIDCLHGKVHGPCKEQCKRILICGHPCGGLCGEPCLPCEGLRCIVQLCMHKKCKSKCDDHCKSGCKEKCGKGCQHVGICTKKCGHSKLCTGRTGTNDVCTEPCSKLLDCGHSCVGYCGETCTSTCPTCDTSKLYSSVDRYIGLPCGHDFDHAEMIEMVDNNDYAELAYCSVCSLSISYINSAFDILHNAMMNRKASVVMILENIFILKSKMEQKKKQLISTCSDIVKRLSTSSELDINIISNMNDCVVRRCSDKRNMLSFSDIGQLEMKLWLLDKIEGQKSASTQLIRREWDLLTNNIISSIIPQNNDGKVNSSLQKTRANIGMDYVRSILDLLGECRTFEEHKSFKKYIEDWPEYFTCFSRGNWKIKSKNSGEETNLMHELNISDCYVYFRRDFCTFIKN